MKPDVTVLLGDPDLPDNSKPGGRFTSDDHFQVSKLQQALAELDEYEFEFLCSHDTLLETLKDNKPGFVLNFCDTGYRNNARLELHIPALLEILGIPYSGAGPVSLGLCYDKALVRAVAASHGVTVPAETFLRSHEDLPDIQFPAFIKPNRGDGSLGITEKSIVNSPVDADSLIQELRQQFPGVDLLIQECLSGAEYSVGIIGNPGHRLTVLPVLEVDYQSLDPQLPKLLSYSSKVDPESPYWNDIHFHEATIDAALKEKMTAFCKQLFDRLQLRDYARFDFRADSQGEPKLMEVNPNPAWCWDGKMAHMSSMAGRSHADMLRMIIEAARDRTGIP